MTLGRNLVQWLALALAASACCAVAQQTTLQPSPALQCLTQGDAGQPLLYPEEMLQRKDGGTVAVELRFAGPDQAPNVTISDQDRPSAVLVDAVRAHVRRFRVPCMAANDPTVLIRQDYVFVPNDGRKVVTTTPTDPLQAARGDFWACLSHVDGEKKPDYPYRALVPGGKAEEQGNVYVSLKFLAPDQPPVLTLLTAVPGRALRGAVAQYANGLRLPCMGAEPVAFSVLYTFQIVDGSRLLLPDLSLKALLAAASNLRGGVYFDLNALGCPFDVRLTYFRPHGPNTLRQLEPAMPARQAFLDWLCGLTLNLPERANTSVLGQTITVQVPCGTVNL